MSKSKLDASDLPTLRKLAAQQRNIYSSTRGNTTSFGTRLLLRYFEQTIALVEGRCFRPIDDMKNSDDDRLAVGG